MGLLDSSNLEANNDDSPIPGAGEAQEPEVIVPGSDLPPAETPSRRQAARALRENAEAHRARTEAENREMDELKRRQVEQDREIYRLRGMVDARPAQPAPAPPPKPDWRALADDAEKLLKDGDLRRYHEKLFEAAQAKIESVSEDSTPARSAPAPAEPDQIPPQFQAEVMGHLARLPELAAQPNWWDRVLAAERTLLIEGNQPSAETRKRAFDDAAARLKPASTPPARPSFSKDNRGMLSGGAHVAEGGSADELDNFSTEEKLRMKQFGLTPKQYGAAKRYKGTF